jgi:hypothetical protein
MATKRKKATRRKRKSNEEALFYEVMRLRYREIHRLEDENDRLRAAQRRRVEQ